MVGGCPAFFDFLLPGKNLIFQLFDKDFPERHDPAFLL